MSMRRSWGRTPTPSPQMGPVLAPNFLGPIYGTLSQQQAQLVQHQQLLQLQPQPQQLPQQLQQQQHLAELPEAALLAEEEADSAGVGAGAAVAEAAAEVGATVAPARSPIEVQVASSSPELQAKGPLLEWRLSEGWGSLSRYPKDFCVTSPIFSLPQVPFMQLSFYPCGSRTSEANCCAVSLTRGPDSAGIKFRVLVNARGIGPKVCLGRRYLGDYPLPFGDAAAAEGQGQAVVVSMEVVEILHG